MYLSCSWRDTQWRLDPLLSYSDPAVELIYTFIGPDIRQIWYPVQIFYSVSWRDTLWRLAPLLSYSDPAVELIWNLGPQPFSNHISVMWSSVIVLLTNTDWGYTICLRSSDPFDIVSYYCLFKNLWLILYIVCYYKNGSLLSGHTVYKMGHYFLDILGQLNNLAPASAS